MKSTSLNKFRIYILLHLNAVVKGQMKKVVYFFVEKEAFLLKEGRVMMLKER